MTDVIKATGSMGTETITVEHFFDGYRIWFGEEFWSTANNLIEVLEEIQGICETFGLTIDNCETWK